jgi:hypothetical protein
MKTAPRSPKLKRALSLTLISLALTSSSTVLAASDSSIHEASTHFQRGVTLYNEADYRAALAEFKRAYALAPNPTVLYNIGETQYQLQDYAGALVAFEQFLTNAGPSNGHRTEVESTVETLRTRVGHIAIVTDPVGAEILVDDQSVGRSPMAEPIVVSIGRRKVTATVPGRLPVTRLIEVAADDSVSVSLEIPNQDPSRAVVPNPLFAVQRDARPPAANMRWLVGAGWVTSGVLAAGATTFAILANKESADLRNSRNTYPTSSATLTHESNVTTTYAILSDSFTVAAAVLAGVSLYWTLTLPHPESSSRSYSTKAQLQLGPTSTHLEVSF